MELTVIVPVFNGEKTISRTLDSLIKQNIEILIVNDGSTDDTGDIIERYQQDYRNITVINKTNGGIASARNVGINNVETKYFGFVDSDDYVEENMFEKMLSKIKENDSDVCVCDFIWEWPNKKRIEHDGPYYSPKEMIVKMFSTLWNKIYKTELIKKYDLFFPDGYRYEDSCFLYSLAANDLKLCFVDEPLVHYVQVENSITHNHNEKVKDMVHVFGEIKKYYINHGYIKKYNDELEFLFAKFFLGNSFLRTCQIKNKEDRNTTLKMSWDMLMDNYPNFKRNKYVKEFTGFKKIYYQMINKNNYLFIGYLIHIASLKKSSLY